MTTLSFGDRFDFAGRSLYELNETNSAILILSSSHRSEFDNLLAVTQFRGRQASGLNYSLDLAFTETSDGVDSESPEGAGSHFKGSLGWRWDYFYTKINVDEYAVDYFPANALLDKDLPGTKGSSFVSGHYREMQNPLVRIVDAFAGTRYREETSRGRKQQQNVFVGTGVEFTNDVRVTLYLEDGSYRPVTDTRGAFGDEVNNDRYASVVVDFNTRSNHYSGGVQYDQGNLGGGSYRYFAAYAWWRPSNDVYLKLSGERTESLSTYNQFVLESTWDISTEHALSGRIIHSDGDRFLRLAYSHRPRRGLDIFVVFDGGSQRYEELSVKFVRSF